MQMSPTNTSTRTHRMGDGREQSVKTLERGEETNDTSDAHEAQQFGVGQLAS